MVVRLLPRIHLVMIPELIHQPIWYQKIGWCWILGRLRSFNEISITASNTSYSYGGRLLPLWGSVFMRSALER